MAAERPAPRDAAGREPQAAHGSVTLDSLDGIGGAARIEPAWRDLACACALVGAQRHERCPLCKRARAVRLALGGGRLVIVESGVRVLRGHRHHRTGAPSAVRRDPRVLAADAASETDRHSSSKRRAPAEGAARTK